MARKRQYIVSRNGVHVGWHDEREAAEADVKARKTEDPGLVQQGWITLRQLELIRYYIEVH